MRLAISRRAAPSLHLAKLSALSRERGLDGVEIYEDDLDDHGALDRAAGSVVALYLESRTAISSRSTALIAAKLRVPVVAARGAVESAAIGDLGDLYEAEGARLLVSHGTAVAEAALLVDLIASAGSPSVAVAWDIDTKRDDLREAPAVLLATTGALGYIRMRGGGPELADEDAAGTGDLVSSLALSGYSGVVTLAPTSEDRVGAWRDWLAGKIKNGCGTAYAKKKSRAAANVDLDIRSVEPKNRMDTIMGAYRALTPGRTLHVTFDHDPSCMFYTLQATEPEGSFVFERKDDGPDVWRADVTKRAV
jgi:uncharacterized protein (DUF2249 family)